MGVPMPKTVRETASGHYYESDGTPMFQVQCKGSDKMRATSLRDVRSRNLYPSVTTICSIVKKHWLDYWMQSQLILVFWEFLQKFIGVLGKNPGKDPNHILTAIADSLEKFEREIRSKYQELNQEAPRAGTEIHKALEHGLKGEGYSEDHTVIVVAMQDWLAEAGWIPWRMERKIIPSLCGYGGTIDLICYSKTDMNKFAVIDFKTSNTIGKSDNKLKCYDNWMMQLVAYKNALYQEDKRYFTAACIDLIVSRDEPGRIVPFVLNPKEEDRYLQMFMLLKDFYYLQNKLKGE